MQVGEAHALRALHELLVNSLDRTGSLERVNGVDDVLDLIQEPLWAGVLAEIGTY